MDCIHKDRILALQALMAPATSVAVVGHTHPDGDALGSTSALALYLQKVGIPHVSVVFSDSPADNLQFILPDCVQFCFYDKEAEKARDSIRKADLLFLVDCNSFQRTEALQDVLEASKARKVLIDHHLNPDAEAFDLVFSTPDISSASELLYWILKELGPISLPVGEALLAGMTTDTNNFANSVYPSTFRMASELIEAGVDRDALLEKIYWSYRENRVRLMGYMQSEQLHILPGGAAYMLLTRDIQLRYDLREGESEGLVNVPLAIEKVRLSVLVKEDGGRFRVSVRSKKGTSAQNLAQRFFHGGGHENAAGGKILPEDPAPGEGLQAYVERILSGYLK
jgi:phosphoesterase RecJ-like protein